MASFSSFSLAFFSFSWRLSLFRTNVLLRMDTVSFLMGTVSGWGLSEDAPNRLAAGTWQGTLALPTKLSWKLQYSFKMNALLLAVILFRTADTEIPQEMDELSALRTKMLAEFLSKGRRYIIVYLPRA